MTKEHARGNAYAELVAGLLDAREDAATERFDAELATAQATGRIDPDTAVGLRWWQRESVRGVVEHARTVLPPALLALDQARSAASLASRPDDEQPHPTTGSGVAGLASVALPLTDAAPDEPDAFDAFDDVDTEDAPAEIRRLLVASLRPLPADP